MFGVVTVVVNDKRQKKEKPSVMTNMNLAFLFSAPDRTRTYTSEDTRS